MTISHWCTIILLGIERNSDGVPWALLASNRDGRLVFAGPAILNPPQALRAAWRDRIAAWHLLAATVRLRQFEYRAVPRRMDSPSTMLLVFKSGMARCGN